MRRSWKDLGIGFLLGCTMSVPGISGGTMAMALGYYRPILKAAADIRRKRYFLFLLRVFAGGLTGFLLGAEILNYTVELLPLTAAILFSGAVLTGMFLLGKETLRHRITPNGILFFLVGFLTVLAIDRLPRLENASPLLTVLWGILLAAGLILPGISTAHLLTVFGLYGALTDFSSENILRLIPPGIGVLLGVFLLTKPLALTLDRFERECNFALLGFSAASLKSLILPCITSPQISYHPWFQVLNGLLLGAGASFLILKIQKRDAKKL